MDCRAQYCVVQNDRLYRFSYNESHVEIHSVDQLRVTRENIVFAADTCELYCSSHTRIDQKPLRNPIETQHYFEFLHTM